MNVVLLVGIGFASGLLVFPLIVGILIWWAARERRYEIAALRSALREARDHALVVGDGGDFISAP
jgi:hypothetical protein